MANKKTDQERFSALADVLADSILQESDEDILKELRASGIDPDTEAARLKALMLARVKAFQQRQLFAAREGYEKHIEQLERKTYSIPKTAPKRCELFNSLVREPQYAELLTAAARNLKALTDEDIETYLEDLAELGILENVEEPDAEE